MKLARVAVVAAHHAVAAVPAHVQERVKPALAVAGQDDRVLAHVGVEEVVGLGDQALVADHQPGAAEDLLHLVVVDGLVAEDAPVDLAGLGVDDGVLWCGTHVTSSPGSLRMLASHYGKEIPLCKAGVRQDVSWYRAREHAQSCSRARDRSYFSRVSLRPSAASLRLAPWVVLLSSMTTPF